MAEAVVTSYTCMIWSPHRISDDIRRLIMDAQALLSTFVDRVHANKWEDLQVFGNPVLSELWTSKKEFWDTLIQPLPCSDLDQCRNHINLQTQQWEQTVFCLHTKSIMNSAICSHGMSSVSRLNQFAFRLIPYKVLLVLYRRPTCLERGLI